jgi:HPt (histidine-containing phosphotransfer) domain-containing protein
MTAMPGLLHLETLQELYPDEQGRRAFLLRAHAILRADRIALQNALASKAYGTARELVHRLQGSASFLSVPANAPIDALCALSRALQHREPANVRRHTACILRYLRCLELEMAQTAHIDTEIEKHHGSGNE